jgi:hypothetical protein
MSRLGWILVVLALAGAGSCGSEATGPVAGVLTVSLATPNAGGDGAILFTVTGPDALTSAVAPTGLRVFSQPLAATTRFAVTGTLSNGAVLTIGVPDVSKVAQYQVTVQAVAAQDFSLRLSSAYRLTVAK